MRKTDKIDEKVDIGASSRPKQISQGDEVVRKGSSLSEPEQGRIYRRVRLP